MYLRMIQTRSHRRTCLCLLFALLAGSMPGALSAGLFLSACSPASLRIVFTELPSVFSVRGLCLPLLFPLLLCAAAAADQQGLFLLAFFGRGFLLAYLLCFSARCGILTQSPVFSLLFFRGILPLPLYFHAAARLLETDDGPPKRRLRLFGLLFLNCLLCSVLASLRFP